jgi:hypothetical protein
LEAHVGLAQGMLPSVSKVLNTPLVDTHDGGVIIMTLYKYPTPMKYAVRRLFRTEEEVVMADLTPPDHNGPSNHGRASRQR